MRSYANNDIHQIHLEVTSKCNAACPMCPRNAFGGKVNPHIVLTELRLSDIQQIFGRSTEALRNLKHLYFCGNYGDPIIAKELLDILSYIRALNPEIQLDIHTNGSARTVLWWKQLGSILSKPKDRVVFGIDGLEDTNHIYRRHTDFSKIIENATALIESGGNAHWEYLVFEHNEHQVEKAKKLAKQLGFKSFILKRTNRFTRQKNDIVNGIVLHEKFDVKDNDGNHVYSIKPSQKYTHDYSDKVLNEFGSFDKYFNITQIECQMEKKHSLYINAEGLVLPCCWSATKLHTEQMLDIIQRHGGKEVFNAKLHSIDSIISGPVFQEIMDRISNSEAEKLHVCTFHCGKINRTDQTYSTTPF
jgi:MoaA/NifB/PqqE/SkfB family radical SAM enzyme